MSPDLRILKGQEWPHGLFRDLSSRFSPFKTFCHPFSTILVKNKKKAEFKICLNGKERVPFPFLYCYHFLRFLSAHMSTS